MNLLNKNYIIYGSSILFSRGLEYLVLFYAAYSLTKPDYGELEFYKRVIEVGASLIAFGFPALLMSYTRSKASKINFLVLSLLVVFLISLVVALVLAPTPWIILVVPFIFYAVFFTGGISHSYFLVKEGSNYASIFKGATALLFYLIVFISIYYYDVSGYAFVYVNYLLFPILAFFLYWKLAREHIEILQLKRYWSLFKKLLGSSFSLVASNFTNLMFLYTDIFVIKLLSDSANIDIANYSFSLNIASMLLLIPITLVQVDVEKLKRDFLYVKVVNRKIIRLVALLFIGLIAVFYILTQFFLPDYRDTFIIFLIILMAKAVQSAAPLYGTMIVIKKRFRLNLNINIISLVMNVILSSLAFYLFGLYGIAFASLIVLAFRNVFLVRAYKKIYLN